MVIRRLRSPLLKARAVERRFRWVSGRKVWGGWVVSGRCPQVCHIQHHCLVMLTTP